MGTMIRVICEQCKREFLKDRKHYNYGLKIGWKPFCSSECLRKFKTKKIDAKCFQCHRNIEIQKSRFVKSKSKRFFCSSSCSAKFNNRHRGCLSEVTRNKIRQSLERYYDGKDSKRGTYRENNGKESTNREKECVICHKKFRPRRKKTMCCSKDCGYVFHFGFKPMTVDEVRRSILEIYAKKGHVPRKRDVDDRLLRSSVKFFGSWNKAIKNCGLKPNKSTYQKIKMTCMDGHIADSISEKVIDDWLFLNNIRHDKNKKYPNSRMNCDFYLIDWDLWVEYFGLFGGNIKEYDETIKRKNQIVANNNLPFLFLRPDDLYKDSVSSYDKKLRHIFTKYIMN